MERRERRQGAPEERARAVADRDAELARAGRARRPARRVGGEALDEALVRERDLALGPLEPGGEEAALEARTEERQHEGACRRGEKIVDERGGEDGLAGLGETGDRKPHGRLRNELAEI